MAGRLTTHVLDTASGRPAAGIRIQAFRLAGAAREPLAELTTNADGRCDGPVLEGAAFAAGLYELVFHVAAYFRATGMELPEPFPPAINTTMSSSAARRAGWRRSSPPSATGSARAPACTASSGARTTSSSTANASITW